MSRRFYGPVYYRTHFKALFLHPVYERIRSKRHQKGKLNVNFKGKKYQFLGLYGFLTGLRNLKHIQNSRQNRSKNKLVRENAVIRVYGSRASALHGSCSLRVMDSYQKTIIYNLSLWAEKQLKCGGGGGGVGSKTIDMWW